MNLDGIVGIWQKKENEKELDKLFKILVLNDSQVFSFLGNYFFYHDGVIPENSAVIKIEEGKTFVFSRYFFDDVPLRYSFPLDWKGLVVKYRKAYD